MADRSSLNHQDGFDNRVAVVGMALRAPGAADAETFWSNIVSSAVAQPRHEPASSGSSDAMAPRQIARIAEFDRRLFGLQPAEALILDPQRRAFLELVWEAFEDAGLDPARADSRIGVFAGCGRDDYRRRLLDPSPDFERTNGRQQIEFGNERDFFATGIAYQLDLNGPAFTIQSACSTSLVAIHVASRSLLTGECDIAIAGGITIQVPGHGNYRAREGGIYSEDGRCRPFTEGSGGTVPASGGGAVVLARARDAEAMGLQTYANIVGTAIGNDGAHKMNFAAPAVDGHVRAIREALDLAGVSPDEIGFVQTHGTGTRLGDEIELAALQRTYGATRSEAEAVGPARRCAIGSIKANIGHADAGAGVLSFAAAALSSHERIVPPTPSQAGDGSDVLATGGQARLFMPREPGAWPDGSKRRAAVSSLGVGGTNAHVVLEEADEDEDARVAAPSDGPTVLTLSAATPDALKRQAQRLLPCPEDETAPLSSIAGTLWRGRARLAYRWACAVRSRREAIERLNAMIDGAHAGVASSARANRKLAVLMAGQGAAFDRAYVDLLQASPAMRAEFERLAVAIVEAGGPDVSRYETLAVDDPTLSETDFAQPLLFCLHLSLLRSLRIGPAAKTILVGHSIGEFVAAIFGGLLNDAQGAAAVVARSKLMASAPAGRMMVVRASQAETRGLIGQSDIEVSGVLSPSLTVVAGASEAMGEFRRSVAERRIATTALPVTRAFHSSAMQTAAEEFSLYLSALDLQAPTCAITSNRDGALLSPEIATTPQYWGRQIRDAVDLSAAIGTLLAQSPAAVLDLGPGDGLANLVRQRASAGDGAPNVFALCPSTAVSSPAGSAGDLALDCLAALWSDGFDIELPIDNVRRIKLPRYPFEDTAFWPTDEVDAPGDGQDAGDAAPMIADDGTTDLSGEGGPVDSTHARVRSSIRRIWSQAFGQDEIGDDYDFFEVGGTSIHATQILSRIEDECGVRVRLHDLYDYPGIDEFSRFVAERIDADRT